MSKLKDITGLRYGRLVVIKRLENYVQENGRTRTRWLCKCDCGNDYVADGDHLKQGDIYSCGCAKNEKAAERMHARKGTHKDTAKSKDLTGQIFGKLTVIGLGKRVDNEKENHKTWLCKCECGKEINVRQCHLVTGAQESCGCQNSKLEAFVYKYLTINNIEFEKEYKLNDLLTEKNKQMRFDFAIKRNGNLICLIECQGEGHNPKSTRDFGRQQREITDLEKKKYCEKHNIELREIWYFENKEQKLLDILQEFRMMSIPCQDSKE